MGNHPSSRNGQRVAVVAPLMACLVVGFVACRTSYRTPSIDIVSTSAVDGIVNGLPLKATVSATFNTIRGGHSSCTFTQLPTGFTPGTLAFAE